MQIRVFCFKCQKCLYGVVNNIKENNLHKHTKHILKIFFINFVVALLKEYIIKIDVNCSMPRNEINMGEMFKIRKTNCCLSQSCSLVLVVVVVVVFLCKNIHKVEVGVVFTEH